MDNIRDEDKTKVQLLAELKRLRKQNERLHAGVVDLKLAEKNFQKLTNRYEAILDAIPDIIIEADVNGRCVWANRAGIEFFGEEVLGKETAVYFNEEQNADETVLSLFGGNDKNAAHVKNWHERKDNEKRLLAWRYQELQDKNGNETGVLFFARDITDYKLFEEDLLKLSSAVKQSPCAIIITDTNGTIEYVNPKFTQLTKYSLKETIGKNPRILQSGQTQPGTYKHLWATIISGNEWHGVFCNKKKNGELYWENTSIAPVKNSVGDISHFIAVKVDITKQRKLEEDLRKSRENLAYAQRIARLGSWAWDLENDVIYGSDETYRIFGLIPQQLSLTYALFMKLVHPLDREYVKESIDAAIKVNNYFNITCRILLPNCEERIIHIEAIVTFRKTGARTARFVGTVHDVTESKRAEAEIKMLARFPNENPNPVLRVARDGSILFSNKAGQYLMDIWGCRTNQQLPDYWHRIILDALNSNSCIQSEDKFGNRVFFITVKPVIENNYVNIYGSDITARKNMEEALSESEERYRAVAEASQDCIFIINRNDEIQYVNSFAANMFGMRPEELIGSPRGKLFPPDISMQQRNNLQKIFDTGVSARFESKIPFPNQELWMDTILAPLTNKTGEVYAVMGVSRNITEHKQLEEKLAQIDKLDSLGITIAGVSHQFNNILAIIDSNVQVLEKHYYDHDNLIKRIYIILKAICDGKNILRRMIDFSRSEEGYSWFTPVNMKTILQQCIDFLTPRWKEIPQDKGIKYSIITDVKEELSEIKGNPSELREALINIMNNAFDAMPGGGILSFKTWEEGGIVFLEISDTGIGMSEKVKKKIFDPFFSTKGTEGTGLGLSIVYGIIKRHGGRIEVKSQDGKGSAFILGLPAAKQTADHMAVPLSHQAKELHAGGCRILVAIKEQETCNFLKELLSGKGYNVEAVDNGITAIELLENDIFDLVLCDLEMPEISGWEIMRAVKTLHRRPKIGLITGREGTQMLKNKKVNADFIVQKPLETSELLKHIAETLGDNP